MADLLTTQKATIDDDTSHALPASGYSCVSSDAAVATVGTNGGYWYVYGEGPGSVTITATRTSDGATGSMSLSVDTPAPPPPPGTFVIQLGAISAK